MGQMAIANPLWDRAGRGGASRMMTALAPQLAAQASRGIAGAGSALNQGAQAVAARRMQTAMMMARLKQAAAQQQRQLMADRERQFVESFRLGGEREFERERVGGAFPDEDMLILDDTMAQLEKLDEAIIKLEADPYSDPDGVVVKGLRDRMERTRANGIAALTSPKAKRFAPGYFAVIAGAKRPEADDETAELTAPGKTGPGTNPFTIFEGLGEVFGLGGARPPVGVSEGGGRSLRLPASPPAAGPEAGLLEAIGGGARPLYQTEDPWLAAPEGSRSHLDMIVPRRAKARVPAAVPQSEEVSLDGLAELLGIDGQSPTTQPAGRRWPEPKLEAAGPVRRAEGGTSFAILDSSGRAIRMGRGEPVAKAGERGNSFVIFDSSGRAIRRGRLGPKTVEEEQRRRAAENLQGLLEAMSRPGR